MGRGKTYRIPPSHLSSDYLGSCAREIPGSPKLTNSKAKSIWMGEKEIKNQGSVCL